MHLEMLVHYVRADCFAPAGHVGETFGMNVTEICYGH